MLILTRKLGEKVVIGDNIVISVVDIKDGKVPLGKDGIVRLGFVCPASIPVQRQEIFDALRREEKAVSKVVNRQEKESIAEPGEALQVQRDRACQLEEGPDLWREKCRYLEEERDQWRKKYNDLCDKTIDLNLERKRILRALADAESGQLRMIECYEGIVRHVDGDEVVVVYEVEGDLVEQTYRRGQFIDGNMPNVNDQVAVHVRVIAIPPGTCSEDDASEEDLKPSDGDDHAESLSREF